SAGGPSYSVPALARALHELGTEVEIWTSEPPAEHHSGIAIHKVAAKDIPALLMIETATGAPVVVHDHGVWLPWNHAVARATRQAGIPRVVSPRGMLEPWAMQHGHWKKQLAWFLYQKQDLRSATMLHATAASEAEGFRRTGLKVPVMV